MKKKRVTSICVLLLLIIIINITQIIFPGLKQFSLQVHLVSFVISLIVIFAYLSGNKESIKFYYLSFDRPIRYLIRRFDLEKDKKRKEQLRIAFIYRKHEATWSQLFHMLKEDKEGIIMEIKNRIDESELVDIPSSVLDSEAGYTSLRERDLEELMDYLMKKERSDRILTEIRERFLADQDKIIMLISSKFGGLASPGKIVRLQHYVSEIAKQSEELISKDTLKRLNKAVGK